jgi:endogenous inhibitor of DNA gyrase (YacG/DUF329 family)
LRIEGILFRSAGLDPRAVTFYLFAVRRLCPTCKRALDGPAEALPFRPFCSERCRSIDLGSWLDAAYRISAPIREEDLDAGPADDGRSLARSADDDGQRRGGVDDDSTN